MMSPVQRRVAGASALALLAIAVLGILQFRNARRLYAENQLVSHTQLILRYLGALRTRIERADAAAQSFVITRNASYLTAYNEATADMASQVRILRDLTADNPIEQQNLNRLEPLLNTTFGAIQKEIDSRSNETLQAEALIPMEASIRQANADANAVVAQMSTQEADLLNQRNAAAQSSDHRANLLILSSSLTAFVLVGAVGIVLYLDITRRGEAEQSRIAALVALQSANEDLEKEVAHRNIAEKKLRDSESSLRDLSLYLLRNQDEERRHIGRELHDSIGQELAGLKLQLGALQASSAAQNDPAVSSLLAETMSSADEAIKEVRTISYLLHPPMLDEMGLRGVIPWYVDGFAKRSGIRIALDMPEDFPRLPADVELVAVRVLQESLTNVHRHSGSSTARVVLSRNGNSVTLEVSDQGKGMPFAVPNGSLSDTSGPLGVGLQGMSERIHNIGGKLEVQTDPRGTIIRAVLPGAPVPAPNPA